VRACFVVDKENKIVYLNLSMLQLLGKKEDELINTYWYEKIDSSHLLNPNELKKFQEQKNFIIHIKEADDNERPYQLTQTHIGEHTLCELQDLSCYEEQKLKFSELEKKVQNLTKALKVEELKFKKTFDMSINGIILLNGKGETTYTNSAIQKMLDYNESYLLQLGLKPLFSDGESLPTLLKIAKNEKAIERLHHRFLNRSGVSFDVTIFMSYLAELDQYLVIIQDVTREMEYTQKLEIQKESYARRADMDVLTPCFSRSYLDILLKNMCEANKDFIYIMFDIDHFKSVNDTYGHLMGDEVLIKVINIVKNELRSGDVLARYGGEEFALVLEDTSIHEAMRVAEKLRQKIEESNFSPLNTLTCSFGMSCSSGTFSCKQLIERADKALYKAKTNGRNRVELYGEEK
jgi:diguanylate cyclase (GGDEF)-like protein/PAS domain S-box-containing protein